MVKKILLLVLGFGLLHISVAEAISWNNRFLSNAQLKPKPPTAIKSSGDSDFAVSFEHRRASDSFIQMHARFGKAKPEGLNAGLNRVPQSLVAVDQEGTNAVALNFWVSGTGLNCSAVTANARYLVRDISNNALSSLQTAAIILEDSRSGSEHCSFYSDSYRNGLAQVINDSLQAAPADTYGNKTVNIFIEMYAEDPATIWREQTVLTINSLPHADDLSFFVDSALSAIWSPF